MYEMTIDEFLQYAKQPEITDRLLEMRSGRAKRNINGKPSYICPICKHGENGDGLTHIPSRPELLKCFGKCNGKTGDIIEFFREADNTDFKTEINTLAAALGITIKPYQPAAFGATFDGYRMKVKGNESRENQEEGETSMQTKAPATIAKYSAAADYSSYYDECFRRIQSNVDGKPAQDYLASRGISLNTAISYGVGYDNTADPANAPGAKDGHAEKPHPARRLIIPCDKGYYTTRAIDENAVEKQYWKMNVKGNGEKVRHILMPEWIYAVDYLFICEGIFDALSIAEAASGYTPFFDDGKNVAAIALNSVVFADELIAEFEKRRPAGIVLICLDNDEAGAKAADKIEEGLNRLTIPNARANIAEEWESICGVKPNGKDPNEMWLEDRSLFSVSIDTRISEITKPDGIGAYLENGAYDRDIANIIPPIPTGFNHLDQRSGGGIKTELYIISAPSSIGKTTFSLHLARRLAERGRNVLYFAMEQSRLELVNKCIASVSYGINPNKPITAKDAGAPQTWQRETVQKAREALAQAVGNKLSIIEWNLDATTAAIKKYIVEYIKRNEYAAPPVVFIDYLQLIQGIEINGRPQQIREVINDTISEMKRISRAYNVPIICISSQARATYDKSFSMGNTKESGNIEYTAGVVWGLQFTDIEEGEKEPNLKKLKTETPRRITLTCDKDRGNVAYYRVNFDYYPAYDYFIESEKQ